MKLDTIEDRLAFEAFVHWYGESRAKAEASWAGLPPEFVRTWYDMTAAILRVLNEERASNA